MRNTDDDMLWFVIILIMVMSTAFLSCVAMRAYVRKEAARAGAGKWIVDQYGEVDFKWLAVESGTINTK